MLAFGWNAYPAGLTIDWALAKQSTAFVYLGADVRFQEAQADANTAGLLVGGYWSLTSDIDPAGQADLFLSRIGKVGAGDLPPAVWVYRAEQLQSLKAFVEALETKTKRRTLIGGTPQSLVKAGLLFGRTNPLWISHKPVFGGPTIPTGWQKYSLWQPETKGQVKGVSGPVGFNLADPSFISQGKGTKLALGLGALLLVGAGLYYLADKDGTE